MIFFSGVVATRAQFGPPAGGNVVKYDPANTQQQQGLQPFHTFFDLTITSPANLTPGGYTISVDLVVEQSPVGVADAVAATFITFVDPVTAAAKNSLSFSGPNESQTVRVKTDIPLGSDEGSFKYFIKTSGWPTQFTDSGMRINAQAALPSGLTAPTVEITEPEAGAEFVLYPGGPALPVAIKVEAAASASAPVLVLNATLSGEDEEGVPFLVDAPLSLVLTGLGTADAQGTVTVPITRPGLYTINAETRNAIGESFASSTFVVTEEVPPPVVGINPPANGAAYRYIRGLTSARVPYGFAASTQVGSIVSLTATLDGEALTPATLNGLGEPLATGSGELVYSGSTLGGVGEHTLVVTATSEYGVASATATFVIVEDVPQLSVGIGSPQDGVTFLLPPDASPLDIPFTFTATTTHGAPVATLSGTVTLEDQSVALAPSVVSGLNTPAATASGLLTGLAPGEYTIDVAASNAALGLSAFDSVTFSVAPPPPPTIAFTQAPRATYTVFRGQPLSIPVAVKTTGTGAYIVSQQLQLDGEEVSLHSSADGRSLIAVGNGVLDIPTLDTGVFVYELGAAGEDTYGEAATAQVSFSVTVVEPVITIAINPEIARNSPYLMPASGTLAIPFTFTGTITAGATVDAISGDLGGSAVSISSTSGIGTSAIASASGLLQIAAPGVYTLTATDSNALSGVSATTSVRFEVKPRATLPPLTVTITQSPQSVYTVPNLCDPLSVPIGFVGKSSGGSVKTLSATLNGQPVSLSPLSGLNTSTASAAAKLKVRSAGTHVLVVKATDAAGQTATTTVSFVVKISKPEIDLTIATPLDHAVYTIPAVTNSCRSPSISVPFSFSADISAKATIDTLTAAVNGRSASVSKKGLGSAHAKGSGQLTVTKPGTYTFTAKAQDLSSGVSASKTVTFTVRAAKPPSVTITSPTETNITLFGENPATLGFAFKATSESGKISKLTARLDGQSLNIKSSGLGSSLATGSGTLSVACKGKHVLSVTAIDASGTSASTSFAFYASVQKASPRVSIADPDNGAVFEYTAEGASVKIPLSIAGSSNAPVSSVKAALNGADVSLSKLGLGSEKATGTATLSLSKPGTYTLTANIVSGGVSATDKVTFTVKKAAPETKCTVEWKGVLSKGSSHQGGATVPVKCQLTSRNGAKVRDRSVQFSVCEIRSDGSYGPAKLYNSSAYDIESDGTYCLDLRTAYGSKRYRIEVYYAGSGSDRAKVVGSKEFKTY